ncbi:MAG: thioesterase family protein [Moraxellaceae bacterium]
MHTEITIGQRAALEHVVTRADLASTLSEISGDGFPAVLATSRMIALMELAAARLLVPHLQEGELSVGVGVSIKHLAATLIDAAVTAEAEYLGREGKLYRFRVLLKDAGGIAGEGEHTRAIVSTERLLAGAQRRNRPA